MKYKSVPVVVLCICGHVVAEIEPVEVDIVPAVYVNP